MFNCDSQAVHIPSFGVVLRKPRRATEMRVFARAVLAGALALAAIAPAAAQVAERTYENGPVWTVGYVETKPGMFDDYMAYLAGPWKILQEAGKRRGDILAYHVLAVDAPREHESDVILL